MHLYDTLAQNQKYKGFAESDENLFFLKHRLILERFPPYRHLALSTSDFDVMRANIIIRALQNKKAIEEAVDFAVKNDRVIDRRRDGTFFRKFIREKIVDLPYASEGGTRLYVPIFGRAINAIYCEEFEKLLASPYDRITDDFDALVIDLFETYNFALYDSLFTQFVNVYSDAEIMAVFHYDFQTIYFIDAQGRLECRIALFDTGIRHPDFHHIIERIRPVIAAYVANDKKALLNALVEKHLVSEKLVARIRRDDDRFRASSARKVK